MYDVMLLFREMQAGKSKQDVNGAPEATVDTNGAEEEEVGALVNETIMNEMDLFTSMEWILQDWDSLPLPMVDFGAHQA